MEGIGCYSGAPTSEEQVWDLGLKKCFPRKSALKRLRRRIRSWRPGVSSQRVGWFEATEFSRMFLSHRNSLRYGFVWKWGFPNFDATTICTIMFPMKFATDWLNADMPNCRIVGWFFPWVFHCIPFKCCLVCIKSSRLDIHHCLSMMFPLNFTQHM